MVLINRSAPTWAAPLRPALHSLNLRLTLGRSYASLVEGVVRRPQNRPAAFILGCGRSGTSILGQLLAGHPDVTYRFEPVPEWAVIQPSTDMWHLYRRGTGRARLGAAYVDARVRHRYNALLRADTGQLLVEKSPENALRLGFLNALEPAARFVHIVRDGASVVQSIAAMAETDIPMLAGRTHNLWWGVNDSKWRALVADGIEAGYFPDEIGELQGDTQRAAYEWVVCMSEVDRSRALLGSRLLEIRYEDLVADPGKVLTSLAGHLGLAAGPDWIRSMEAEVHRPTGPAEVLHVRLPPQLADAFNNLQHRFAFPGSAVPFNRSMTRAVGARTVISR